MLELSGTGCEKVGDVVGHKLLPSLGEVGLATAHLDRQFLQMAEVLEEVHVLLQEQLGFDLVFLGSVFSRCQISMIEAY